MWCILIPFMIHTMVVFSKQNNNFMKYNLLMLLLDGSFQAFSFARKMKIVFLILLSQISAIITYVIISNDFNKLIFLVILLDTLFCMIGSCILCQNYTKWKVLLTKKIIDSEKECVICLDSFDLESKQLSVKLPCKHIFHKMCIMEWFIREKSCPTCRIEYSNLCII